MIDWSRDETHPLPACRRLVDLALERGAPDNVTVVVARYDPQIARRVIVFHLRWKKTMTRPTSPLGRDALTLLRRSGRTLACRWQVRWPTR